MDNDRTARIDLRALVGAAWRDPGLTHWQWSALRWGTTSSLCGGHRLLIGCACGSAGILACAVVGLIVLIIAMALPAHPTVGNRAPPAAAIVAHARHR